MFGEIPIGLVPPTCGCKNRDNKESRGEGIESLLKKDRNDFDSPSNACSYVYACSVHFVGNKRIYSN